MPLAGCGAAFATPGGCVQDFAAARDYFPVKSTVQEAERFSIEYHRSYKVVTVTLSSNDPQPLRYLLVLCGTPPPAERDVTTVITIPVRTTVTLSNAYLPMLEAIGAVDSIVAVNDHHHVNSTAVRARIDSGNVVQVGREINLDRERLAALKPDIVLTYGSREPPEALRPLARAGLNAVITAEYRETTPLAYAEWVKFLAAFFNAEAEAERHYDDIAARYRTLRSRTARVSHRPLVLVGGSYRGVWYAPAPQSYTAQIIADAGADYAFRALKGPTGGSEDMVPVDLETAIAYGRGAQFWIDTLDWRSLDEARAQDRRYALFDAYVARRLYNNDARRNAWGANDFWESGLANPDTVLADLIAVFHPELAPGHTLRWYRRLPETVP